MVATDDLHNGRSCNLLYSEHALDAWILVKCRSDERYRLDPVCSGDHNPVRVLSPSIERFLHTFDSCFHIRHPGRADAQQHMTTAENLKDLLSHRYTCLVAVLANVSESPARRRVRVHCNDWNSAVHRFLHNIIKSSRIRHGSGDAIDVVRNSRLDEINLLLDIEVWRAGVSHFRTEHFPGVFSAFAKRHERPNGRRMSDDSKLIFRKARPVRR